MTPDRDILSSTAIHGKPNWLGRMGRSNTLTMVISAGLHAALFFGFYRLAFTDQPAPRRIIIPEARLAPSSDQVRRSASGELPRLSPRPAPPPRTGGAPGAGSGANQTSALQISEMPVVAVNLGGGAGFVVGSGEGPGHALSGPGVSNESLMGSGLVTGAGMGGGMLGPATSFFGAAGNAYKIVYTVDVSNSLMYYRKDIINEVRESIRNLTPSQEFNIVLAKPNQIQEFNPQRLLLANARNKAEGIKFIEGTALARDVGLPDPIGALDRAARMGPELIYFLTDGDYDKVRDELIRKVDELHKRHGVKITVISIEPQPSKVPLMERIAKGTGGFFRAVQLVDR